jgi:hypothetical protein
MTTIEEKLGLIKKLYRGYYNTDQPASLFGEEFFYSVGEVLDGKQLSDLKLKYLIVAEL